MLILFWRVVFLFNLLNFVLILFVLMFKHIRTTHTLEYHAMFKYA